MSFFAQLRPLGEQEFQNIARRDGASSSLIERRAAGLTNEIAAQLEGPSAIPLHERLAIASIQVQSFVEVVGGMVPDLKARVTEIGRDLSRVIQTKTIGARHEEAAEAGRRAEAVFRQFKRAVTDKADDIRKTFKQALKTPGADVVQVFGEAKARIAEIQMLQRPGDIRGTEEFFEAQVTSLERDLASGALSAQVKKTQGAFKSFAANAKRLERTQKFLTDTQRQWMQLGDRPITIASSLAAADFAIPDPEAYSRSRMGTERDTLVRELQSLRTLANAPAAQSSSLVDYVPEGVSEEAWIGLKAQAKAADALFKQAATVRRFALSLTGAKTAANQVFSMKREIEEGLEAAEGVVRDLRHRMGEYDPANRAQIEALFREVRERHAALRESIELFEHLPKMLHKAIPNIDFDVIANSVRNDFGRQENSVDLFTRRFDGFKALETRFEEENFEGLSVAHFTAASGPLYDRLKEIIKEKLKPLTDGGTEEEILAAREYKQSVVNWLKQVGSEMVNNFNLDILKPTFREAFLSFIAWIVSWFASLVKADPVEPQPVALDPQRAVARAAPRVVAAVAEEAEEPAGDPEVPAADLYAELLGDDEAPSASAYYEQVAREPLVIEATA